MADFRSPIQNQIAPGLNLEDIIALLMPTMAPTVMNKSLLSAPIQPSAPSLPAPVAPAAPAGIDWGSIMQGFGGAPAPAAAAATAPAAPENPWMRTWHDREFASQWPLPRNEGQTGLQNLGSGVGNAIINSPQNFWTGYQDLVKTMFPGNPLTEGVKSAWQWATTPEGELAAAAEAGAPPAAPTFTPGLPSFADKTIAAESGGDPKAKNKRSSATGAGQFVRGTWLDFMREMHPDELGVMGEREALKLREDPTYSSEAIEWYKGKGTDVLDAINEPATDTNLYLHHFLGGGGVQKLLSADPTAKVAEVLDPDQIKANPEVLGGGQTVQDVINWAAAKQGELPGQPPNARPDVVMPDFSQVNKYLDAAAPRPVDEKMLQEVMFANMLMGLGQAAGGDARTGGEFFGNLGAGVATGVASGKEIQLGLQQDYQKQIADYNLARAGVAGDQEGIRVSGLNAQGEVDWQNAEAQRGFLTEQDALAKAAGAPKILQSSADGIWIQTPEGIEHISTKVNEPFEQLEALGKAFGQDSVTTRALKYNLLSQTPGTNLLSFEMEIARDLVTDGLAPQILGDAYTEVYDAALKEIPPELTSKPELYQEALNKALTAHMLALLAGDSTWILQAAQLGNPGAALLVQGGTFTE